MQKEIEAQLALYVDDYLEKDLISAKVIKAITVADNSIQIDLSLGYPCKSIKQTLLAQLKAHLAPIAAGKAININLTSKIDAHVGNQGMHALPKVKNIIAVASGKGGVGKSTVAVNLALALAKEGASVGMLDADIYGPSQPAMLGASGERPLLSESKQLIPIERHDIKSMSIGYLVEQEAAMVWRGPMIGKAMHQMLHDTEWGNLDYLIIDLPPGTGDIQLTLCQKIPVSCAVIVTTPQDMALLDVRRACEMFKKLNVPILGVVENMSMHECGKCGHEEPVFGAGGGEKLAQQFSVSMLAKVPLNARIREMTDSGHPPVVQDPESRYAKTFSTIAIKVAAKLSQQTKDYSARFPKVVVEPLSAVNNK